MAKSAKRSSNRAITREQLAEMVSEMRLEPAEKSAAEERRRSRFPDDIRDANDPRLGAAVSAHLQELQRLYELRVRAKLEGAENCAAAWRILVALQQAMTIGDTEALKSMNLAAGEALQRSRARLENNPRYVRANSLSIKKDEQDDIHLQDPQESFRQEEIRDYDKAIAAARPSEKKSLEAGREWWVNAPLEKIAFLTSRHGRPDLDPVQGVYRGKLRRRPTIERLCRECDAALAIEKEMLNLEKAAKGIEVQRSYGNPVTPGGFAERFAIYWMVALPQLLPVENLRSPPCPERGEEAAEILKGLKLKSDDTAEKIMRKVFEALGVPKKTAHEWLAG